MPFRPEHRFGIMNSHSLCEALAWDSEFFGRQVAHITAPAPTCVEMQEIFQWCRSKKVDCLYFLADSQKQECLTLAEEFGFHMVDIRLTLDRNLKRPALAAKCDAVRPFEEHDLGRLQEIATVSHRDSRFYADPNFPRDRCDELYRTWITKSFQGFADQVLVAAEMGQAVGYITCHLQENRVGKIGLFAVAASAQGKALGRGLIHTALHWLLEQGMETVTVVTQARNLRAQRAYQKCGFRTSAAQVWYHKWFNEKSARQ